MKTIDSEFFLYLKMHRYSVHTIRSYEFVVRKLCRLEFENCTYTNVLSALSDQKYSLRYRQVMLAALKQYFHFLVESGKRDNHPCPLLSIKGNYCIDFVESDLLSPGELQLLSSRAQRYSLLDQRDKALLSLLTHQGLNTTEIVKLRLANINLRDGSIWIGQSRKYLGRKLSLVKSQIAIFENYIFKVRPRLNRYKTDSVFLGKSGTTLTSDSIHYLVSTLKQLIPEKKLSPRLIRQSVIAWWIKGLKIPLEQVQLMCGHRWISTTQRYQFYPIEQDVRNVNRWL